ncbi:type IV secretory system conjugative DNA transfer family protein [Corynebacterium senegalense]|uniref:type IV secretory system conjugative DNA transfer family protein n=1 Tax=Corynebacterium senegalense TaxID=2080750 RepID=UPI000E1FC430|nr:type IV secretory system conjugative DNA transfer family protein [Corynebacterium senegalense]
MREHGRDNPRAAGNIGWDIQTILGFCLLGASIAAVASIQFGQWVQARLGEGAPVSRNPFTTVGELIGKDRVWGAPATAAVVAAWSLAVLAVVAIVLARRKFRKPKPRVDAASKYLASKREVVSFSRGSAEAAAKKWLPTPALAAQFPGLMFGRVPETRTGLWSTWEDLYLIIFGPRMGKTTSQVIPAIVDAPGHVVTTSNKRDIVDDTIGVTSARGEVWVFDPQRIAAGFQQDPWFFDPLDLVRRVPETMDSAAVRLADIFKTAARGAGDTGGDAYFTEGGKELLGRFFLAAALDNRPIGDVYLWVNDDADRTPVGILERFPEWRQQAAALAATYQITEKTRSGLFSQAAQMATPLGRREALKWVTPTPTARKFDAEAFVRGPGRDTVYLLSKEGADNAAALTTALTATIMTAAEAYGEECGGRLPVPLVAALDEAANVVRWPELPSLYSHYGSRGIILMTILQSYAQGAEVWGENGMELLWSAAAIVLYGGGVRDDKMLQKIEALVGDVEVFETSTSRAGEGARTVTRNRRERKILTVAELASLDQGRALVLASRRRPLIAQMEPWWQRRWPQETMRKLGAR